VRICGPGRRGSRLRRPEMRLSEDRTCLRGRGSRSMSPRARRAVGGRECSRGASGREARLAGWGSKRGCAGRRRCRLRLRCWRGWRFGWVLAREACERRGMRRSWGGRL
jgi:hypothetical protein